MRIENAEFYTDDDGAAAVRFYIRFTNTYGEETSFYSKHFIATYQDGVELTGKWFEDVIEEESNCNVEVKPGEEILCARAFKLRTGSPVVFVVEEIDEDFNTSEEAALVTEVKEP